MTQHSPDQPLSATGHWTQRAALPEDAPAALRANQSRGGRA